MSEFINRGTGLLIIDVKNSNPNGDPDRDSDPRTRQDGRGEISPVSFKRKLRDLVADKESQLWKEISEELGLSDKGYDIFEQSNVRNKDLLAMNTEDFLSTYWDARIFGATVLEKENEEGKNKHIASGVAQFGLGVSLDPIKIRRQTTTKMRPVEDDKSKGMAPLAYRIVEYGLYAMPFFINGTAAHKTHCTKKDIELLLRLIPHAYKETASYIRSQVDIRYAFYVEHKGARGTFNDLKIIEALTPVRLENAVGAASSWKDYDEAALNTSITILDAQLKGKTSPVVNLMDTL